MLFGGLSTQAGAFEPVAGDQARALRGFHGVVPQTQWLDTGYGGNLGYFSAHGVQDAALVARVAPYIGAVPSNPLAPRLERPNPWVDPSAYLR